MTKKLDPKAELRRAGIELDHAPPADKPVELDPRGLGPDEVLNPGRVNRTNRK